MSISELDKKRWINLLANGLLIWIIFVIFSIFMILDEHSKTHQNVENAKRIYIDINSPFLKGGMLLAFGLLLMIISKIFKRNLLIVCIGILTLITYYLIMLG